MKMTEKFKNILKTMGNECKRIRLDRGYTQEDVAKEIGVPLYDIQAFENGRSNNAVILLWYVSILTIYGDENGKV